MRYLTLAAAILMAACTSTTTTVDNSNPPMTSAPVTVARVAEPGPGSSVVVLTQSGDQIGTFAPRSAPYNHNGSPAVIAWLPGVGGTDEQGRTVSGVKFIGWNDGGWTHVQAYALIAQPGQTNLHDTNVLEPRMIGEYVMHSAESAPVAELGRFGVAPLIVKSL